MKNKSFKPRCSICGKFIKISDFNREKIMIHFTPDTEFTNENISYNHKDHNIKIKT